MDREKYFKWARKPEAANVVRIRDGKPLLTHLFLHSVNEYGLNTYCVPHTAGSAGAVTVNNSVKRHGVHDPEAGEVSQ